MAERLFKDPHNALDTLAREELGIDPKELGGSAWQAAIASFLLFAGGALIPLLAFFFLHNIHAVIASVVFSAVGLYAIGALITLVTGRSAIQTGLRQLAIGLGAAAVTYGIGHFLGVSLSGLAPIRYLYPKPDFYAYRHAFRRACRVSSCGDAPKATSLAASASR